MFVVKEKIGYNPAGIRNAFGIFASNGVNGVAQLTGVI